jgi:hypothetical protein
MKFISVAMDASEGTAMTLSPKATDILARLRARRRWISATGERWGIVYLDNARPAGMSAYIFAGYLSVLAAAGLYRPCRYSDGCYGNVRMDD